MASPQPEGGLPPPGLYAITPDEPLRERLLVAVEAVLAGGCRLLQYRDKVSDVGERLIRARSLVDLCRIHGARLIINDDVDLALAVAADGVHLGREDGQVAAARRRLGPSALIGASCYDDFSLAQAAQAAGANYVAFGAVYPSTTKPGAVAAPLALFARARQELAVPACAIGGITLDNAAPVVAAGAAYLAVISDLFSVSGPAAAMTRRVAAYQRLFEDLPR